MPNILNYLQLLKNRNQSSLPQYKHYKQLEIILCYFPHNIKHSIIPLLTAKLKFYF